VKCLIISSAHGRVVPWDVCDLCPAGQQLYREHDQAANELRRERADAARPDPNQDALFDLADLGGR